MAHSRFASGGPLQSLRSRPRLTRRSLLLGGLGATAAGLGVVGLGGCGPASSGDGRVGFTVAADPTRPDEFRRDLDELAATGAHWIRLGIQSWELGGYWGGQWLWQESASQFFSDCLRQAREARLRVSLTLAAMADDPTWSLAHYLEVNRSYWTRCAQTVAAGGGVEVVQVYNEHDLSDFRSQRRLPGPATEPYLRDLATAIGAAREELQRELPSVQVTTAVGGAGMDDNTEAHWRRCYDVLAASVDVLGVNCYPGSATEVIDTLPARLGRLSQRYGKPVIVTEIGIPTEVGGQVSVASAQQALPRMIERATEAAPVAVLVYQLRNRGPDSSEAEENFGILDVDHDRRPTYDAVVAAIRSHERS